MGGDFVRVGCVEDELVDFFVCDELAVDGVSCGGKGEMGEDMREGV